ncbi:MAG: response regulator [Burkholderiales bacterium]|nr:response regulator [Burkholderiales bacterium]
MAGSIVDSGRSWIERSLDGLDMLRDSLDAGLQAAAILRQDGEARMAPELIAAADIILAFAAYFDNRLDESEGQFRQLASAFDEQKDASASFFAYTGLVNVLRKSGRIIEASQVCEAQLLPMINDVAPRLTILAANIYGILSQERGNSEQALRYFCLALDLARKMNFPSRVAQITSNLGEVLYVTGNLIAAEEIFEEACHVAPHSSEKWLSSYCCTMLALCKIALWKCDDAYTVIAPYIADELGDQAHIVTYRAFYLAVAAYTLAARSQFDLAEQFCRDAIASMDTIEDPSLKPYVWWVSGFIHRRCGRYERAIDDLKKAIDEVGETGYVHLPLHAINELAENYAEMGRWEDAYREQKRHQTLFAGVQERANQVQAQYLKIRSEHQHAEKDRRLHEQMSVERKSLNDELQRMLDERETILENSIVGMLFLNSQGRVQWVNTPLCQIFGVQRDTVLGSSLEPFYESRERYLASGAAVAEAILRGESYETELQMRRSDGSLFWVQFSGRAVNKKDLSYGTVWVVIDISARRQLEADLHKSEYNYRLLINNVTEGIIVVQDARIAFANRLIQTMTGYEHNELIGLAFTKSIYADDVATVVERHARRLRGEVVEQYYQIRLQHRVTGQLIWVEISSVLIQWEGQPATLSFVSDLTQRKLLESQLKESMDEQMRLQTLQMQNELKVSELARRHAEETTEAKSLFLANMSHEIRTPMNAIIGMAHLALKTELTVKQKDYVEKIHKAGMSLMGIINDILDFSKIEAGKLDIEEVEFDLDEVFSSVAVVTSEKAEEKGLEYLFDMRVSVPKRLKGDPLRLGQVLINLINNSIKFTEAGEVCLHCDLLEQNDEQVRLKFQVRDTGLGMTIEQSSKLFVPFSQGDESTTRKFGGTGLGLSISKGMIELMGGQIRLDSELGKGTAVTFELPFVCVADQQAHYNRELFDALTMLIVDDHPFAAELLADKLNIYGIRSESCNSAQEELSLILEREAAGSIPFDAVFVDLHMPEMNGTELIALIRASDLRLIPKIGLVGATARESLNYRQESTVVDAYLDKPFNASNVFDCLVNMFSYHTHVGATHAAHGALKCRNVRVLLVEDNLINQQIAKELLEAADIEVDVANNGKIAVEQLRAHKPDYYQLVFMDVQMPEMDGHAATKLIRSDPALMQLPIIAMTAHALLIERERCLASGMSAHLAKPINPGELFHMVAQWCPDRVVETMEVLDEQSEVTQTGMPLIKGVDTRIGLSRTMGDRQLYFKLLRLFVQDQRAAFSRIVSDVKQGDYKSAERIAHTLKGVAGLIGAHIHELAARLEMLLESEAEFAMMSPILAVGERQLADTITEIEDYLEHEHALLEFEGVTPSGKSISSEDVISKLRYCYQLVCDYDGEALEALSSASEELNIAFGPDVQKQIMRAASQYDFDVIMSIMKGNAQLAGMTLV